MVCSGSMTWERPACARIGSSPKRTAPQNQVVRTHDATIFLRTPGYWRRDSHRRRGRCAGTCGGPFSGACAASETTLATRRPVKRFSPRRDDRNDDSARRPILAAAAPRASGLCLAAFRGRHCRFLAELYRSGLPAGLRPREHLLLLSLPWRRLHAGRPAFDRPTQGTYVPLYPPSPQRRARD
jgi:hypothetical protein